ncbi:hypothetical protein IFM89_007211 [Coptis chinensis]|uniref:Ribulose bisphosphate carboxylase small subunit n=1 Tax=Coptis chinensis TaxID=261450 RepID=A0A835GWD0_9MAGN|nr:hypothetical protein IFM89_007211 [Coptis chinensis]
MPLASINATPAQASMVALFTGLKSTSAFPITRKTPGRKWGASGEMIEKTVERRQKRMIKNKESTTQSRSRKQAYTNELENKVSRLEEGNVRLKKKGFVSCEYSNTPRYYDGRYWTMWKLPMFGCTDASQVLAELEEAKKAYPNAFVKIIRFDNKRQVQCISFIAYKPENY